MASAEVSPYENEMHKSFDSSEFSFVPSLDGEEEREMALNQFDLGSSFPIQVPSNVEIERRLVEIVEYNESMKGTLKCNSELMKEQLHIISEWRSLMNASLSQQKQSLEEAQLRIQELEKENLKLHQQSTSTSQKISEIQQENENLADEIKKKIKVIGEKEESLAKELEAKKEVSDLKMHIMKLETEIIAAGKEKEVLSTCSEQQIQTLKEQFESELKRKDDKLAELQKVNEQLSNDVSEKNIALEEKKGYLSVIENKIKLQCDDICSLNKEIEKFQREIVVLSKDKAEIIASNEKRILAQKEEFDSELKMKDQKEKDVKEHLIKIERKASESNQLIAEQNEKLKSLKALCESKEKENADLKAQLDDHSKLKSRCESLELKMKSYEESMDQIQKLVEERLKLLTTLQEVDNKFIQEREALEKERMEHSKTKKLLKDLQKKYDKVDKLLQMQSKDQKEMNEVLMDEQKQEAKMALEQISLLTAKLMDLEQLLEMRDERINMLSCQLQEANRQLEEIPALKAQFDVYEADLNNQNEAFQRDSQRCTQEPSNHRQPTVTFRSRNLPACNW